MSSVAEIDAEAQRIQGFIEDIKEGLKQIAKNPQSAPKA
jgi:hypothetical protein